MRPGRSWWYVAIVSNGLKLGHRKFHTNMWKSFMIKVMEDWNRLPRKVVKSFLQRDLRPVWICAIYCRVRALAG